MVGSDSRVGSSNAITGMENSGHASPMSSQFKDWRLKLHNDVVHLYKAGNPDAETPRFGGNDRS